MFQMSLFSFLAGFGVILADALKRIDYSLSLAVFGAVLIALAMIFFIAGMLKKNRLSTDSHDSLP